MGPEKVARSVSLPSEPDALTQRRSAHSRLRVAKFGASSLGLGLCNFKFSATHNAPTPTPVRLARLFPSSFLFRLLLVQPRRRAGEGEVGEVDSNR